MQYSRPVFFVALIFAGVFCNAQKYAHNWLFGENAGIFFDTDSVICFPHAMVTNEGCASISDFSGNLLFYTDGMNVWNHEHSIMQNGSGLHGDSTTSQSAMIVPFQDNVFKYYVFTLDWEGNPYGLEYAVVDMAKNNGLGAVVSKNNTLHAPMTEHMTAVFHRNKKDIWVVTHEWNSNNFYAYLVTSTGIQPPVISSSGKPHLPGSVINFNAIGTIAISPDRKKLALGTRDDVESFLEVFNFDNSTGVISSPLIITDSSWYFYGVGFSPDGSKLYTSSARMSGVGKRVRQYDLNAGTSAAIINSGTDVFSTTTAQYRYQILMGPDSKLYVAAGNVSGNKHLDVIENPNLSGALCNYQVDKIILDTGSARLGLPNFIVDYTIPRLFYYENNCYNDNTRFTIHQSAGIDSVKWTFGDIFSPSNVSKNKVAYHKYTTSGLFKIELVEYIAGGVYTYYDTVIIHPLPKLNLGNDTTIADTTSLTLDAGASGYLYAWTTGDTTNQISVDQSGTYGVTVTTAKGCSRSDEIKITVKPVVIDGIDEPKEGLINIYPYNSSNSYALELNSAGLYHSRLQVFNSGGQLMLNRDKLTQKNIIDCSAFDPGIYFFVITNEKRQRIFSEKIILQ